MDAPLFPHELFARVHANPITQDFLHHVRTCSAFEAPPSITELFQAYHRHVTTPPQPEFYRDWRPEAPGWRWKRGHHEAVFDSVQNALGAVIYHKANLARIERDVLSFHRREELFAALQNTSIGGGNTQKINFEYHAYVLAYRRVLDYLARATSALIRHEFHSFRTLPEKLERHVARNPWLVHINSIHAQHVSSLGAYVSLGETPSTRDLLSHYSFVQAGCMNATPRGIFFVVPGHGGSSSYTMSDNLERDFRVLETIVREFLEAFKTGLPKP